MFFTKVRRRRRPAWGSTAQPREVPPRRGAESARRKSRVALEIATYERKSKRAREARSKKSARSGILYMREKNQAQRNTRETAKNIEPAEKKYTVVRAGTSAPQNTTELRLPARVGARNHQKTSRARVP